MKIKPPKITLKKLLSKRFILGVIIVDILIILVIIGTYSLANRPNNNVAVGTADDFVKIIECFNLADVDKQKCLDAFIKSYASSTKKSIKEILTDLESARLSNVTVEDNCHVVSHSIGRYTYTQNTNVGSAFEACDLTCNSGCYHGVMERLFFSDQDIEEGTMHLSYEDMAVKIPGICDKSKFDNPTHFVLFQCYHGLGHAVEYFSDYDLDQSLRVCDLVEYDFDQLACYGGVFMENITAFNRAKRDLKMDDPHYPCNRVEDKYKSECYGLQTSIMLEQGLSHKEMAEECRKAGDFTARCFDSYGRDLSNLVRSNQTPLLVKACEVYASEYERNCITTAVYVLIDSAADGRFSYPFCEALTQESNKQLCFNAASSYMETSFYKNQYEIEMDCKQYATEDSRCER